MPDSGTLSEHASSTAESTAASLPQRIVLFDGVCGFCNRTVDFLLKHDPAGKLTFAPLQGTTAARLVPSDVRSDLSTLAYWRSGRLYYRSGAVVRILRDLGGPLSAAAAILWLIPAPLRDLGYRLVAAVRYRVFGRHESCRVPSPEERQRFLD